VLQAQIIQRMLAEIGVGIEIRSMEFGTFYSDVQHGNFQIFSLNRFGAIDPNIYALILQSDNVPPRGQNRGYYQNPEFDRLIDAAARLTDPEARRPLYLRAQEIFRDDLPYISLYTRDTVAVMPAILKGYVNYPTGELFSLKEVYWDRAGSEKPAANPKRSRVSPL
jgi:peptide/nickel transport system substrate-binding protein